MLQTPFPFLPDQAVVISKHCALVRQDGQIAVLNAAGVFFCIREHDRQGRRTALGMLSTHHLASVTELAAAFSVSRGTVYRCKEAYRAGGVDALKATRTSKGGYKLNGDTLVEVQSLLDRGRSLRAAAQAVGLTHTTVSRALEQGRLRAPNRPVPEPHGSGSRPSARSAGDALCAGGIGVKRTQERVRASTGQLAEAPPRFEAAETVAGAGVLLALPALLQQGLLDVTEGLYGRLNNGFFGLRSVLLTLAFMALLRIRSPEQLKAHAPGELGLLLGLDRAPEVKTVRRKLHEIGARKLSRTLADTFARRWAQAEPEALGYLYIDGHVRPYHGRRHRIPKTFVQRRRLCMPATTEVWVNDARAQPWFFVTTEANDHLLAAIERDILAPLRKEVGAERRVTLVFDREGWSPKAFARWAAAGFDVMTYRKGRYDPWPEDAFVAVVDPTPSRGGKPVTWRLAECETDLGTGRGRPVFRMREVRRLCDNGHQTSIMTTRRDLATPQVASRMFARWRQENFFRYMRQEYNLDHLCTYATEAADPQRPVPNPQRKKRAKELAALNRERARLEKAYTHAWLATTDASQTHRAALGAQIQDLNERIGEHRAVTKSLPHKVPVGETLDPDTVVRLEPERKIFTDLVRTLAYRAESALLGRVGPLLARDGEEGRAFLKALFATPADLVPNDTELLVRFHSMAQPRLNRALRALCEAATDERHLYPGTSLRMVFEGPSCLIEN